MGEHISGHRRPVLGIRDDGVERLIAGLPASMADDINGLRLWTRAMTRSVSSWQVAKGQQRARNRLVGG